MFLTSLTPIILTVLLEVHFILHPILFKKFTKSFISGSIAQFDNIVVPFAKLDAIIRFSVAPTDTLGNLILFPTKPFGAFAIT